MPQPQYDIVTVGGGLGGSALAMAMAKHGARVLVLEQENRFRDRVRGEGIVPWGADEMRLLGIYELIRDRCGRECQYLVTGSLQFTTASSPLGGRTGMARRDLVATTPQHAPSLSFFHPAMQETLLAAAAAAGADPSGCFDGPTAKAPMRYWDNIQVRNIEIGRGLPKLRPTG